jgi:hypothetical protein
MAKVRPMKFFARRDRNVMTKDKLEDITVCHQAAKVLFTTKTIQ